MKKFSPILTLLLLSGLVLAEPVYLNNLGKNATGTTQYGSKPTLDVTVHPGPSPVPVSVSGTIPVSVASPLPVTWASPMPVAVASPVPVVVASPLPVAVNGTVPVSVASPLPVTWASPMPVAIASPVPVIVASPLPVTLGAGANTIGALTANQSVNVAQINGATPLMGAGNTGTGSQRVTIATDQAAVPVSVASPLPVAPPSVTTAGTLTRASNNTSSATLMALNAARKGLLLYNDSTTNCFVKFGATASTTSFAVKLFATDSYSMDPPIYTGVVDYICDAASGNMEAVEL